MKQLVRGQRIKLSDLSAGSFSWQLEASITAPGVEIDWCCFGVDSAGKLSDERFFVFYNQPNAPQDAIRWRATSQTSASFQVHLNDLPPEIKRLVFTATIDGTGSMNQIRSGELRLKVAGQDVGVYAFVGSDFLTEGALLVGEFYWKDEWRFAAVGQGFAGKLEALLKHFGGEVLEEPTPAAPSPPRQRQAPPSQPTTQPPSPFSPPEIVSAPVVPAAIPQHVAPGGSLQTLIDAALPGGVVTLMRDEYQGPITITKPITLDGRGSVLWGHSGPIVTVSSTGVVLRDLEIEVTVPEAATGDGEVALKALPSTPPRLENVRVRGRVLGLGEEGPWSLPPSLHLGTFAPRVQNDYRLHLCVPVACQLKTGVAGLELHPSQLTPGEHEVTLLVNGVAPETLVLGHIEVRSPTVTRSIPLTGNTLAAQGVAPARQVVIWGG